MCDDEVSPLVVDNGSGMVKAGFAGDDASSVTTVQSDAVIRCPAAPYCQCLQSVTVPGQGRMRAAVCGLLMLGLLAALAEGYYIKGSSVKSYPQIVEVPQVTLTSSEINQVDSSQQDDDSFIASEETEEGDLWSSDEDPDWIPPDSLQDEEDDGSFIVSEETDQGDLWASDDDPDWIPSNSMEEDGEDYNSHEDDYSQEYDQTYGEYSQEDDQTYEEYSQEDDQTYDGYSQEDDQTYEEYSQEDDQTYEGYSQEDDQTSEEYSQEDDSSHEHEYTQTQDDDIIQTKDDDHDQTQDDDHHDQSQVDSHPFPEGVVPLEYNAQYGSDDWRKVDDQQNLIQIIPLKTKRSDQERQQQVVQVPAQVVQVPAAYQSQQDRLDPGLWSSIYEGEGSQSGVSTGVEPLLPVEGPNPYEVGAGVEPEGVTTDKDKESGGSSVGGFFREGWRRFTGAVEHAAGEVHDKLSHAVDKIHQTYHGVRYKVSQLVERFKKLISKFGVVIQEGVFYCLRRFDRAIDQAKESEVFEKLEKELEKGHAEVAKFFQILGEKVRAWKSQHASENIDAGLIEGYTQEGQTQLEEGPHNQDIEQNMPDFLQDQQVVDQLNKLKDVGVLTQDDIIILREEHVHQNQHGQHQDHQQDQLDQHDQNHDIHQQNQQQSQQNQQQSQQNQQQSQQNHYYQQQSQANPKFIQFPQ